MKTTLLKIMAIAMVLFGSNSASAQCSVDTNNIYTFTYNGATYEVVRENQVWSGASSCAVARGGYLAEINDQAEQDAIYAELSTNAGITVSNTVAPDGGGASYVWIGGKDFIAEGIWNWDGANTGAGVQFWQGDVSGNPVGGLYNNWGNEPDNFNNQDALGLAITDWPLGVSGQWNDVDDFNTLYYLIEYPNTTGLIENSKENGVLISPNPVENVLTIESSSDRMIQQVSITDVNGKVVMDVEMNATLSSTINIAVLPSGMYYVTILMNDGAALLRKL